ncbi:MAG TPA: DUF4124 domain-containing protein [Gammaproteobacteria bacterium]
MKAIVGSSLALCACLLGAVASAEVYKWTDAEGRVHFGDRPPQGQSETVQMPGPSADSPAATPEERLEKQRRLLNAFEEERRQKRDAQAQARQEKAERQRNCAEARDHLHNQETASAIYRLGPDGQRVYLDDAQREQTLARARAAVEEWCRKS